MSSEVSTDTTAVVHPDTDEGRSRLRHRRVTSWLTILVLVAVIGSAVADGLDLGDIWGVDDDTVVAAAGNGTTLSVQYPTVTRPALASPFEIVVERSGGFDSDLQIAIDVDYLEMWDLNGLFPTPMEEQSDGDRITWTYAAPDGDTLRIFMDSRIEPGMQLARRQGAVSLLEPGEPELTVRFVTKVRP